MKKLCLPVLVVLLFLFVSCAAGTTAADDSVGYITFGSSRAGLLNFGITALDLSNLELTGSHKGGATQLLGSWSSMNAAAGTEIEVQTGSWTLTLKANWGTKYFSSTKTVTIEPGITTPVSFVMEYLGKPANLATTGDIIFTNGYAESPNSNYLADLMAKNTPESVAVLSGGNVYGINLTDASVVAISSINNSIPAGWSLPSISILQSIQASSDNILSSLSRAGSNNSFASRRFWAADTNSNGEQGCVYMYQEGQPEYKTSGSYFLLTVKQY